MKKFIMALLLFGMLSFASKGANNLTAKHLVFLNFPEKVIKPGELGRQTIKNTTNTRIFFHYLNATGREQVFNLKFEGHFYNFKSGIASDFEPGKAGANANIAFLKAKEKIISNPRLSVKLPNNHTVSGIAEAKFIPGEKWVCEMGTGKPVSGIKIVTTDKFHKTFRINLENLKPYHYRLGDNRSEIIPGDYGYNYNFSIANKTNNKKLLLCYINPRGGKITGVFHINGKVISTQEIEAKTEVKFYHQIINSNQSVSVQYVPTGGYAYPVNLKFKLIET